MTKKTKYYFRGKYGRKTILLTQKEISRAMGRTKKAKKTYKKKKQLGFQLIG